METDILKKELLYRTARSGGSGGQNVNKVETKVEIIWHVETSNALNMEDKSLVITKLANNINKEGYLQVTNQTERSQLANKQLAEKKIIRLIEKALKKDKPRKPVRVPPSVIAARLEDKKRNSEVKAQRQKVKINKNDFDLFLLCSH